LSRHAARQARKAAPAKPDDADLAAAGFRRVVDGGLDVRQHARRGQPVDGGFQRDALFHPGLVVAQVNAGLDAVKSRRRYRQVALGGEAVGHGLDVRIDAENLLQTTMAALGLPAGSAT
jgi:hypothetical protein